MMPLSIFCLCMILTGLSIVRNVVSQTCYYQSNRSAGSSYVPCGKQASGHVPCCGLGHLCLSDNACWDPKDNVTYLYGCTDATFQDNSCSNKCGMNLPWVGLVYCNGSSNEWSCCPTEGEFPKSVAPCACAGEASRTNVAFAGPATLAPILSLPISPGGSTSYFPQQNDASTTITSTPSRSSPSISETGSIVPSASTSDAASSTDGHPSNTPVKLGLGLGISLGVSAIGMALCILVRCLLKRHQQKQIPPIDRQIRRVSPLWYADANEGHPQSDTSGTAVSQHEDSKSHISSTSKVFHAELPSDPERGVNSPVPRYQSFDGAVARGVSTTPSSGFRGGGSSVDEEGGVRGSPSTYGHYKPYRPSVGLHEMA